MSDTPAIAAIREQHENDDGFCYRCSMSWPCDSSLLLAALDQAAAREAAIIAAFAAEVRDRNHRVAMSSADVADYIESLHGLDLDPTLIPPDENAHE